MINFTRCAFMAKQACATFSQVVQKITPPIANNFLKFFFALFAMLTLNAATAWAEEVTYVFTSKEWAAKIGSTAANWTSNKAGAGFSNNGIQVTTAATGANGTSPISYDNISQIVVTYNTNTSKGKGTLSVKIGDNAVTTNNWQYSGSANGTSANFTSTFDYSSPQSGKVTLTANTTTNSIYVVSIKIVTSAGTEPPTPANPYKVTLEAGPGTCAESVTEASAGAGVTLPTPTLDCGDWEFVGWTTSSVTTKTTSKPEILLTGTYSPSTDITLYAVYKRTETTEGAGTTEVTKTVSISDYASAKSWINDNRYTTVNIDANITATASSDPATNTGKYYSNDNSWRFYQNEKGKLTITANEGITLKSITLTFTNKDYGTISYNSNSCTSNTAISVSGQSATFTVGSSSGSKGKILITKISVTYESTSGGASTTYYHSTPECAAPCADVVTIRKGTSDNGSFKLDKTGEQSTCNGAVTVTLSDIQPAAGYKFSAITQSGINTGVTIDNNNQKVTYAKNTTGTSTINVTFTELPKYTVTFDANTNGICSTISLKEESAGAGVKLPDVIANDGYRFLGWATTNNATTANAGVAGEIYKPAIDVTLYAVYIQQFTVQWFANGELLEKVTYDKGAPLLAPTMPVNPCSDEKQHIGWTTQKEYYDPIDAPSPFFEEISGNVTANLKFYAVYATIQSAGLQPQELTETITFNSFTDGTSTRKYDGASSMWVWRKNDGSNIAEHPEIRLYAKHSMTITPQSGCSISKIVATISEDEYVSVFANGGLNGADKSVSELDVTLIPTGGNIVITQSNQSRVVKFVVTFTAAVETPEKRINYTTSCTPPAEYTITWWANGEEYHSQTAVEGTAIDVPTNSPNAATYACDDKVFVGWVDAEIIGSTNTEPTFITEFGEIEGDKAFFAVFATETSAGIESTIHTLTPSNSWSGYKEGSITDDKGYTWSYNAAGQSTDGVYSLNLRNKDTETSYIGSPLFTANVKNIKATIVNGSASKARKVYVCSAPTLEPTTGDLGITEVAGGHSGELSLAFEGTISQFYLQVSDALQFQSIVVEVGATTTYSGYVTTCEAATEALSGTFSVGKYEVAQFATGNLQYKPSTATWRFAKQQYQYVGKDNIYVGKEDYKGWIDLFGWSADDKFGVNSSNDNANYQGEFVDWGKLFPEEGWSTLSKNQWYYLLNQRTNAASLKQIAMVGETLGIMLFPDEWTLPAGCAPTQQTHHDEEDGEDHSCDFVSYNYTLAHWTELEKAGAIFLPAAGRRTGGWGNETISPHMIGKAELDADGHYKHYADYYAYYWTSTKTDGKVNYLINCTLVDKVKDTYTVHAGHVNWAEEARYGQSVRLAKVTNTLIQLGSDDNSDVITANAGKSVNVQVNRTFKANDGYYTLCLPFDLAAEKIGNVLQISSITENVAEQGMNVVFAPVEILEAGQPYLLLPSKNIENPIFEGVTIVNTTGETTEPVSGAGIKITLTGIINGGGQTDGSTEYYVGDHGYLYNGSTAKLGLRAFFTITDDADQPVKVRARVVVGENTTTGVDNSQLPITNIQKVIENGQLIIIRNGEKFNAQGQKL